MYTIAKGWLDANITDQTKIADGKFCNDRTTTSGSTWAINGPTFYYAAYNRRNSDSTPSLKCGTSAGDIYTTKVGLITLDEVRYAGGSSSYNGAYYLNTSQKYWTMSPSDWYAPSDCPQVFYVEYGSLTNGYGVYGTFGVRPVINLSTSATVTGGNGTYTTPYIVS